MILRLDLKNLAYLTTSNTKVRQAAYQRFNEIIQSQEDLMLFLHYRDGLHAGWSRGLRRAINNWLKYAISNGITLTFGEWIYGWNMTKLIQKSHPNRDLLEDLRMKGLDDHDKNSRGERPAGRHP